MFAEENNASSGAANAGRPSLSVNVRAGPATLMNRRPHYSYLHQAEKGTYSERPLKDLLTS